MKLRTSHRLVPLFAVVAGFLAGSALRAEFKPSGLNVDTAAIERAVLETNVQMTTAADSLNAEAFFDFIVDTDKGLIVQNGTIFRTRQEALAAVKRGFQGLVQIDRKFENPQVTVVAPDAALLVADGSVAATFADGRTMTSRFAVSLVFVLRDGRWKVLHGHYSMPPRN